MTSLLSQVKGLALLPSSSNIKHFRILGLELEQDRASFDKEIIAQEPEPIYQTWTSSRPTIVFVDNSEDSLSALMQELMNTKLSDEYQFVGIHVPVGTDPDKVVDMALLFGDLVIIDNGQEMCPVNLLNRAM
jgi:hypothetical protein